MIGLQPLNSIERERGRERERISTEEVWCAREDRTSSQTQEDAERTFLLVIVGQHHRSDAVIIKCISFIYLCVCIYSKYPYKLYYQGCSPPRGFSFVSLLDDRDCRYYYSVV